MSHPGGPSSSSRTTFCGQQVIRVLGVGLLGLGLANCSQAPGTRRGGIDTKYGVAASPRVVAEGQNVPKGGGRTMVGKPYTVAGKVYTPRENPNYAAEGIASWYGTDFHGRLTANGEIFDKGSIAAAHPTMPLPSYARITNVANHRSIVVRVNDRGPFHAGRVIDLSKRAAEALDYAAIGTAHVKVEYLGRAFAGGSDDRKLLATLRIDGAPAPIPGVQPTMVASAEPAQREEGVASEVVAAAPVAMSPAQREQEPATVAYAASPARAPTLDVPSLSPVAAGVAPMTRPTQVASLGPQRLPVATAPLPAERPFDLMTIPNAAVPIASAVPPLPPRRPVMASLYYAAPDMPAARLGRTGPWTGLKPQAATGKVR